MDATEVRKQIELLQPRLVEWRRSLHRIPEISFDLPRTESALRGFLEQEGIGLQPGYDGPGVVALIEGGAGNGPVVAIRADIDALEIQEVPGRPYGSTHPGRMHACGHDAHAAMALGAALFLQRNREKWGGTLKVLFQPAEETMGGAQRMLECGAFGNPSPDFVLGLHIGNIFEELTVGQVGVGYIPIMAAVDSFNCTMTAAGGHGAYPHTTADPVLAASSAITQLHTVVSRSVDPIDTAVITVGEIHGGNARNIIPTEVTFRGTVRTLRDGVRDLLEARIREVLEYTANVHRCGYEFNYTRINPVVQNNPRVSDLVRQAALDLLGEAEVRTLVKPSLGGEDVAFFLTRTPGCYFGLSAHNPEAGFLSHHHCPVFDIDEAVLWRGSAVFSLSALRLFGGALKD
ncbi:M20 family metallopeptidase [bacterium]|nr:M20 family metallopeptidase [bacterium]